MTGSVDLNFLRNTTRVFLDSANLKMNVDWTGNRTVTNGTDEMKLETLIERVNEVYKDVISESNHTLTDFLSEKSEMVIPEDTTNPKEQIERHRQVIEALNSRKKMFNHFNRVIELYENSERSRWFIGRIIYRIVRIFKDWKLHTVLGKFRQDLEAPRKFEESFKNEILPFKYKDARKVHSKGQTFFVIPREDFTPIITKIISSQRFMNGAESLIRSQEILITTLRQRVSEANAERSKTVNQVVDQIVSYLEERESSSLQRAASYIS